jgi:hypothetical protein
VGRGRARQTVFRAKLASVVPTELPPRRTPAPGHSPAPGAFERWFLAGFVLLFFAGLGVELFRHYTPAKLSVIFFLLAWFPLLALHEAGHALAARLCGWRVKRMVIGFGGAWRSFRVGGVPVELGRLPLGGFVELAPGHLRQVRLRSAFIYFAGPGVELALLGVLALALGPHTLLTASGSAGVIAAQGLAAAILVDVITNLVPLPARRGGDLTGERVVTDGLGMLLSFVWPRRVFEQRLRERD